MKNKNAINFACTLVITFCIFSQASGAAESLSQICTETMAKQIIQAQPEKLLYIIQNTPAIPFDLQQEICRKIMSNNANLFYPAIEGYPKPTDFTMKDCEVCSAVFSPDGQFILTSSRDTTVKLWSIHNPSNPLATFQHQYLVNSAVFSPDGQFILTASLDNTAKLWSIHNPSNPLATFQHKSDVCSAVFSPDGQLILTSSSDTTAKLWSIHNPSNPLATFQHQCSVNSAVFSPDGQFILTASFDTTAKLWSIHNPSDPLATFQHQRFVESAVFSPDGQFILTASFDTAAKLWCIHNPSDPLATFQHQKSVCSAIFSPNGQFVLTASRDNTAKLWSIHNPSNPLATFQHKSDVCSAVFSPDCKSVLTAPYHWNNTIKLWDFHPLFHSHKYRNSQLSIPELCVILLILKYPKFIKINTDIQTLITSILENIDTVDGAYVPEEQRIIKNFFAGKFTS